MCSENIQQNLLENTHVEVWFQWSCFASNVKNAAGVDKLLLAKSIDLANLQSNEDELDIANLKIASSCSNSFISDAPEL